MSTYKLTYFHTRGLAEPIRFILKQAGVDFEDVRISGEDWEEFKPTTPYGSMPVLEVDGKMLAGSVGIARFLAERFGLAGSNDFENAEIASIISTGGDLALKMIAIHFEEDETKKADLQKQLVEETFPKFLGIFEKLINSNGSPDGWLYGESVTYADLTMYIIFDLVKQTPNALDKYPNIEKNMASVATLPNIAKWLAERPVTQH